MQWFYSPVAPGFRSLRDLGGAGSRSLRDPGGAGSAANRELPWGRDSTFYEPDLSFLVHKSKLDIATLRTKLQFAQAWQMDAEAVRSCTLELKEADWQPWARGSRKNSTERTSY